MFVNSEETFADTWEVKQPCSPGLGGLQVLLLWPCRESGGQGGEFLHIDERLDLLVILNEN